MILEVFKSINCPFSPRAIRIAQAVVTTHQDVALEIIDVRENRQRARQMNIRAVPTLVLDDQVIYIGAPTIDELDQKLKEFKADNGTPLESAATS